jgi:hypothetical protein
MTAPGAVPDPPQGTAPLQELDRCLRGRRALTPAAGAARASPRA